MLKKILENVSSKFDINQKKGIFVSVFDKNGNLLLSKWTVFTDKSIKEQIEWFYNTFLKELSKKLKVVVVDVVKNIVQLNSTDDILSTDVSQYWLLIVSNNGEEAWIILPDVKWVSDVKNSLYLIKKKFDIKNKKVIIYRFETERIVIV